jgi:hypothetical protein
LVGHIELHPIDFANRSELPAGLLHLVLDEVADDHERPRVQQLGRDPAANAARSAGHQRDSAFERTTPRATNVTLHLDCSSHAKTAASHEPHMADGAMGGPSAGAPVTVTMSPR